MWACGGAGCARESSRPCYAWASLRRSPLKGRALRAMRRASTQIGFILVLAFAATAPGSALARDGDRALRIVHQQGYFSNGVGKGSRPGPSAIQRAFTSLV